MTASDSGPPAHLSRASLATAASRPFGKRGDSALQYWVANSTSSDITAPTGTSGRSISSHAAIRARVRSTTAKRSRSQPPQVPGQRLVDPVLALAHAGHHVHDVVRQGHPAPLEDLGPFVAGDLDLIQHGQGVPSRASRRDPSRGGGSAPGSPRREPPQSRPADVGGGAGVDLHPLPRLHEQRDCTTNPVAGGGAGLAPVPPTGLGLFARPG